MCISVKNIATGVVRDVKNTKATEDGKLWLFAKSNTIGTKWLGTNPEFEATGETIDTGGKYKLVGFRLKDGLEGEVEVITKSSKPRKPRTPKAPKPQPKETEQPAPEETPTPEFQPVEEVEAPVEEAQPTPKEDEAKVEHPTPDTDDNNSKVANAIANALKGLNLNSTPIDEAKVREIVTECVKDEISKLAEVSKPKWGVVKFNATKDNSEKHPMFDQVLWEVQNDRATGKWPWLYGPAGSGKSTLCKQVADAMGLPFYSVSSLQQKYELEGYTDAVGKLVVTVLYKVMTEGGILLFDEASTTSAEVQVAFNSCLANLRYNFPGVGMVDANPNCHFIAADNTAGWGGDAQYHARYALDASTLDRYTPIEVGYTDKQDMAMADGDKELVTFIKAVRVALDEAELTYTASPRAIRSIEARVKAGFPIEKAVLYGLCSGWNKQDRNTIAGRLYGSNKYFKAFKEAVNL